MNQPEPEYVITEMHSGKLFRAHYIRMPEDTKRHPLKSLNGFRRRSTKRASEYMRKNETPQGWPNPPLQFRVFFPADYEMEVQYVRGRPTEPALIHENVFDFYNHIGYDHKRDRFNTVLGVVPNGEGQQTQKG